MFFSPSSGGFYDPAINPIVPADAVRISRERFGELIAARAAGKVIAPDRNGRPTIRVPRIGTDQLRAAAVVAVKAEARRRILAVASIERQTNDNAVFADWAILGQADVPRSLALTEAYFDARARRHRIDAIREASNAIEAQIARMPAANLTAFDPSSHPNWPEQR